MTEKLPSAYLSPTSRQDQHGRTDLINRDRAAREGSAKLLAAMLRYYEKRKAAA